MATFTKFYETAPALIDELVQFEADIAEFVAGNIDPVKFKAIRVAHGVYEQRQPHTYMIRIRCAAGGITPAQLIRCAEVGKKYGSGEVHFTTRAEVQVHDVLIENVMNAIRELLDSGLSTRGGGGNTIRNILTSPDSGIASDEAFDVDPYAMALTTRMINEEDSWNLPRKFKIAFSHNTTDTAYTQSTCLGFVATIKDGQKGFEVYCAGGMGAKPMVGNQLFEFIPESKAYHVTRALKTMFDKHGNRRNRYANRIKFLWKKLERDEFVRLFHEEYNLIKDDESLNLVLAGLPNDAKNPNIPVETVTGPEFETWKKRYVVAQKQQGLVAIKLPLVLGDLLSNEAKAICDFLVQFGDNTIRCDRAQNMRIRNIPEQYLGNLYNIIHGMTHHLSKVAPFIGNMINCTGAQTCKLGICLPRGLSTAIRERLINSSLDLDAIDTLRVNMSGCPNTCGMHHIADIGFFGKVGRKDGDMYPAYNVLAGAKVGVSGHTEYAQKVDEISAKDIPNFLHDFLQDYIPKKTKFESFNAYLDTEGRDLIKTLCDRYRDVPSFAQNPEYYTDWGAKKKLSLDELGTAECSAGMFDMIEVDEKAIKTHKKALLAEGADAAAELYQIIFAASRMLLVTRGLDSKTDEQVFEYFGKHFIEAGFINAKFRDVVTLAKLGLKSELVKHQDSIVELADAVVALYKSMDDSLKFKTTEAPQAEVAAVAIEKDYRGVACPMNFVKTKLVLDTMTSGQQLKIILDDGEPIQNVPNSVALEGHKVLSKVQNGPHWEVLIEKK